MRLNGYPRNAFLNLSSIIVLHGLFSLSCGQKAEFKGKAIFSADATAVQEFSQIERPLHQDEFNLTYTEEEQTEAFIQGAAYGSVDILLVVDNSSSMEEEHKNLSSKLQPLLTHISHADWRIAITSTTRFDSCRSLIDKKTPDADTVFQQAIDSLGTNGSGYELGLFKAATTLEQTCQNQAWLRPDSTLAILIVSDEDNCSYTGGIQNRDCRLTGSLEPSYLLDRLAKIRNVGDNARVYGIISHPDQPCATAEHDAPIYAEVIAKSHGHWGDICQSDYTATLEEISKNIALTLRAKFPLKRKPINSSVKVKVNGQLLPESAYQIQESGELALLQPPQKGEQIEVSYLPEMDSLPQTFTLNHAVDDQHVVVLINGEALPAAEYTIDAQQRLLHIKTPLSLSDQIQVQYREPAPLQDSFQIEPHIEKLVVRINGVSTTDYEYDSETGIIYFSTPPVDGAQISIEYEK